jgi:hypothetical protein
MNQGTKGVALASVLLCSSWSRRALAGGGRVSRLSILELLVARDCLQRADGRRRGGRGSRLAGRRANKDKAREPAVLTHPVNAACSSVGNTYTAGSCSRLRGGGGGEAVSHVLRAVSCESLKPLRGVWAGEQNCAGASRGCFLRWLWECRPPKSTPFCNPGKNDRRQLLHRVRDSPAPRRGAPPSPPPSPSSVTTASGPCFVRWPAVVTEDGTLVLGSKKCCIHARACTHALRSAVGAAPRAATGFPSGGEAGLVVGQGPRYRYRSARVFLEVLGPQ